MRERRTIRVFDGVFDVVLDPRLAPNELELEPVVDHTNEKRLVDVDQALGAGIWRLR